MALKTTTTVTGKTVTYDTTTGKIVNTSPAPSTSTTSQPYTVNTQVGKITFPGGAGTSNTSSTNKP